MNKNQASLMRDDIRKSLRLAGYSCDVWLFLVPDHVDCQRYADGMEPFIRFFQATRSAHYTTFVIKLAGLYDGSDDAFTLNRLFDLVSVTPNPRGKPLREIRTALDAATTVGRRLYLIRSKRIAHRTDKIFTRDFYGEASLTDDCTRDLLRDSQAIFSDLSYHLDQTREDFSHSAEPDLRALLEAISK